MTPTRIKIGFVPSLRGGWGPVSDWCARMREEGIRALQQIEGLELVFPRPHPEDPSAIVPESGYIPDGVVCNLDHAEAVAEYFFREKVDGIVIGALNFGDERSASKIAELLKVPVMLYATREPPVPEGPSLARISDSYCGTLSIAAGLYRRKLPFHFAGILLADEPAFRHEAETFLRAVAVVKSLKNARIGQIGLRPSGFETVAFDEKSMIQKFGQNVIYLDLADLVLRARDYFDEDPRLAEIAQRTRQSAAQITVAEEWIQKAARLELAIREFWQRARLSAMAMSCWSSIQRMYGISVCAIFGKLTGDGLLTACEADVVGALSMLTQRAASLHQAVPHFIDWTIQHRDHPNRFLAWHCGNAPACLAADPSRTALRSRQDMLGVLPPDPCDDQAGLYQFQLRPGPVTLCRLAEYDGQWKMLIASGEIIPSDETLTGTWAWVQVRDHSLLYRTLVEEGFIHHASLIHGNQRDSLLLACKFLDIRPVIIE